MAASKAAAAPKVKVTPVLDHGYVRLLGVFGDDLMVVNAARVSFNAEHAVMEAADRKLLRYLWEHHHASPFYHPKMQFEVKAPIFVARQWQRHIVDSAHISEGVAWNELSRRYTQDKLEFYEPKEWRQSHKHNKQASEGVVATTEDWKVYLNAAIEDAVFNYESAIEAGIAGEQARFFLPANIQYTTWQWTCSLYAALHFVTLRAEEGAQWEIQQYAKVIQKMVKQAFPDVWAATQAIEKKEQAVEAVASS